MRAPKMMPRSGSNFFSRIFSGLLLGVVLVSLPNVLQAASIDELMNQKKALESESKALKNDASEHKQEIGSLQSAINFLDGSINNLSNDIKGTEHHISETSNAITQKEAELAQKKSEQDESVRIIYELQASDTVVESLLANETLSEATNRVEYIDALQEEVAGIMVAVTDVKTQLEGKRHELDDLKKQQEEQRGQLEGRQTQKERLLKDEKVELSKINKQLDANQTKIQNIEAQIAAEVAALWRKGFVPGQGIKVSRGTPIGRLGSTGYSTGPHVHFECLKGGSPVNPRGCVPPLSWPLSDFSVTQEFGRPNWNAAYSWHTGIDMVAPYGTPVLASCNGEIILRRWYGGYGNAVVIACDNGWWTLYGHMIN